jgi:hypothetical protein
MLEVSAKRARVNLCGPVDAETQNVPSPIDWARRQQLRDHLEKFVLVVLATYADANGKCWPSQERLCADTGLGLSTLKRKLASLLAKKLLARVYRHCQYGRRTSNRYILSLQPAAGGSSDASTTAHQESHSRPSLQPANVLTTARSCGLGTTTRTELPESKTTTVGTSGEVAAAGIADQEKEKRQALALSLAEILKPESSNLVLPQAEKIITAQIADFGEAIVKQALGRLRTRILGGEQITNPARVLQYICEDVKREKRERAEAPANPYAEHGVSRWG